MGMVILKREKLHSSNGNKAFLPHFFSGLLANTRWIKKRSFRTAFSLLIGNSVQARLSFFASASSSTTTTLGVAS